MPKSVSIHIKILEDILKREGFIPKNCEISGIYVEWDGLGVEYVRIKKPRGKTISGG